MFCIITTIESSTVTSSLYGRIIQLESSKLLSGDVVCLAYHTYRPLNNDLYTIVISDILKEKEITIISATILDFDAQTSIIPGINYDDDIRIQAKYKIDNVIHSLLIFLTQARIIIHIRHKIFEIKYSEYTSITKHLTEAYQCTTK
jgi:hypothetical protein